MTQMPKTDDQVAFENAIKSLEAQAANIGAHVTNDATARQAYSREITRLAEILRRDASNGRITWAQAAKAAQETRNLVMETFRLRSTPVGRSFAEKTKPIGQSLNFPVEKKAIELFGEKAIFAKMTISQKNRIYAAIVSSAGTSNKEITTALARLSFAGRGVIVLSVGLSVYTIATSTNKLIAAKREALVTGASIGGGIAGGAAAGLA